MKNLQDSLRNSTTVPDYVASQFDDLLRLVQQLATGDELDAGIAESRSGVPCTITESTTFRQVRN